MGTQREHLIQCFLLLQNLSIKQDIYIYYIKKYQHHRFITNIVPFQKIPFYENFTTSFAYLYGIFVCICMVRGFQGADTNFFEGLALSDVILV